MPQPTKHSDELAAQLWAKVLEIDNKMRRKRELEQLSGALLLDALYQIRRTARWEKAFKTADLLREVLETLGMDVVQRDDREAGPLKR